MIERVLTSLPLPTRLRATPVVTRELARFLVVGASGTLVNYFVLALTYRYFGWPVVIAALLSNECATVCNFFCHEHWTFTGGRHGSRKGRFLRYQFVATGGILITTVLLTVLVHYGFHYLIANAFAICIAVVWNFTMSRRWAWRRLHIDALEPIA